MADSERPRSLQIQHITQHFNLAIRSKQSKSDQNDVKAAGHECASDDSRDLQSNESVADDAEPRRLPRKGFLDMPGEIRNEIYRLICARDPVRLWFKDVNDEIPTMHLDDYAASRSVAMLRVNPQISQEFFGIFSPPILCPERYPGWHRTHRDDVCALCALLHVRYFDKDEEGEYCFSSICLTVEALYTRQEWQANRNEYFEFKFDFDYYTFDLAQDCINSISDILRDALADASKPMLLNFLTATDRILTMNFKLVIPDEKSKLQLRRFEATLIVRGDASKISVDTEIC